MDQITVRYQAEALKPLAEIVYPSGTNIHKLINDLNIPKELHDNLMVFRDGALVKDYDLIIEENEKEKTILIKFLFYHFYLEIFYFIKILSLETLHKFQE